MNRQGRQAKEWMRCLSERPAGAGAGSATERRIDLLIRDQLARLPEVRSELVVPLRTAIEENRYYVPEEQVAERMIFRCLLDCRP